MAGRLRRLGLRLRPLFDPAFEEEQARLRSLEEAMRAQRQELVDGRAVAAELSGSVRRLEERLAKAARETEQVLGLQRESLERWRDESITTQLKASKAVDDSVRGIRAAFSRQGSFTAGLMKRARHLPDTAVREQQVLDRLARIARGSRPILAGPWTGEVGFELIYWIPFLRWFVRSFGIDPGRIVAVSRGGPRSWYAGVAGEYRELLDLADATVLQPEPGDIIKQRRLRSSEVALIRRVVRARGGQAHAVVHPSHMFDLFKAFFNADGGIRHVFAHTLHEPVRSPGRGLVPGLPPEYFAAKFYFRPSFPDTPANRACVQRVLSDLAARAPVVLLDPGFQLDDHQTYGDGRYLQLTALGVEVTPQNNLEVQTAVVQGAQGFVGTYGGFCYLAPLAGVPAVAYYDEARFHLHHRYMADAVFAEVGAPSLTVLPVDASDVQRRMVLELMRTPRPAR